MNSPLFFALFWAVSMSASAETTFKTVADCREDKVGQAVIPTLRAPYLLPPKPIETGQMCAARSMWAGQLNESIIKQDCEWCCRDSLREAFYQQAKKDLPAGQTQVDLAKLYGPAFRAEVAKCQNKCGSCMEGKRVKRTIGRDLYYVCLANECRDNVPGVDECFSFYEAKECKKPALISAFRKMSESDGVRVPAKRPPPDGVLPASGGGTAPGRPAGGRPSGTPGTPGTPGRPGVTPAPAKRCYHPLSPLGKSVCRESNPNPAAFSASSTSCTGDEQCL